MTKKKPKKLTDSDRAKAHADRCTSPGTDFVFRWCAQHAGYIAGLRAGRREKR